VDCKKQERQPVNRHCLSRKAARLSYEVWAAQLHPLYVSYLSRSRLVLPLAKLDLNDKVGNPTCLTSREPIFEKATMYEAENANIRSGRMQQADSQANPSHVRLAGTISLELN
jgi:hypothetical protein